jgi:HSP20 family protein
MANLVEFTSPLLADEWFDRVLPRVLGAPVRPAQTGIRLDVQETPEAFLVEAEIPGVSREAISVDIDEDVLSIAVEVKREKAANATTLLSERTSGKASRAIRLPQAVHSEAAEAKYVDGVLHLTLPKSSAARVKRLAIG